MKFFPPSQLPPMREPQEEPEETGQASEPFSRCKQIARVIAFLALGLAVAAVGIHLSGKLVWAAAVPVALFAGSFVASTAKQPSESPLRSKRGGGPVLW
jgi:F0F1-type ATP synthase membrane subunit c/vacuolar-type H+-ATPase subunit K